MNEEKVYTVPTEEIIVPENRVRKDFNKEGLIKLAKSFEKFRQFHPGVCSKDAEGNIFLVAGERRLRACEIAKIPYRFCLEEEVTELQLLEIEVEENLNREDLTWGEEVAATERLHQLRDSQRQEVGKSQTERATAKEAEISLTKTHEDLELAQWSREFTEVRNAPSRSEARKVIKKLKGMALKKKFLINAKDMAQESVARKETAPEKGTTPLSEEQREKINVQGFTVDPDKILDMDKRIIHGEMEKKLEDFEDGSVQVVFFDPPWGVDFDKVKKESSATDNFKDNVEEFYSYLGNWLSLLYKKMHENSHLYMFFGIVHHQFVYHTLDACGFKTNKMPIYWIKQGAHSTRTPDHWPGRAVEPIAFAKKGTKPILRPGAPDYCITPQATQTMRGNHPSAKHPDIYLELLKRSAYPGDTIIDPMCGSGMLGVAAEVLQVTHKLDWWMIEKDKSFRDLAMMNCTSGYYELVTQAYRPQEEKAPVIAQQFKDLPELPEDFTELEPGTDDWMRYWKKYPEKQKEMVAWREKTMLSILAGNKEEADSYAQSLGLQSKDYYFIFEPYILRTMKNIQYVRVGTWRKRKDLKEIEPLLINATELDPKDPAGPQDFKQLDPGTPSWKAYWKEHPEKQEEMLAWRKEEGV